MGLFRRLFLCLPLILTAGLAYAEDEYVAPNGNTSARSAIYIGVGKAGNGDRYENDDTPFSIGFMHQLADRKLILGADLGREGTMLDSTWGRRNAPEQATSFNFLIGGNVVDGRRVRVDAALLVGVRESTADCRRSYLGYQCYADTRPEMDYKGNAGGVVTLSFDRFVLGVRATGESTQVMTGFRF